MVTTEIKDSLRRTLNDLRIAENEMNRPVEDVMTLSLCFTARHAMNELMRAFLSSRNFNDDSEKSLHDLLDHCKSIDKQFEAINLSKILCNGLNHTQCEDKYCLTNQNVTDCVSVANTLKLLVLNKLQLNESELA